ncbi:MAG: leucine-rich repeat protein, partial [Bacteroidales bacterium]|nr:leucine-rich repeat protein [Bacteroidales bacterium]
AFDFAGNDMYPVHDGMIYARLKSLDGLALLAAPCQSPKTDVVLLPGTVYIADYALAYSKNLNNVTMPENLKYVGPYAFYNDQALQNVTCYAVEAPQLLDNAFGDVPFNKVYLHIKPGSYNSYQAAGWLFLMGDDITGDYPYVDPATGLNAIAATGDAIVVSRCGDCLVVTAAQPIATVAVYDIAGRLVGAASAHGQNTATVQAVDNAGVHVMRVVFTSGKRATVKF